MTEDGVPYNMVVVAVNDKGEGEKNPFLFYSEAAGNSVPQLATSS